MPKYVIVYFISNIFTSLPVYSKYIVQNMQNLHTFHKNNTLKISCKQ